MFIDTYKELCNHISTEVPDIKHIDIWRNQPYIFSNGMPFSTPAVFLAFRSDTLKDLPNNRQQAGMQVKVYLYHETLADSSKDAPSQESALAFGEWLNLINRALHGSSGDTYNNMSRIAFQPEQAPRSQAFYSQVYSYQTIDDSAAKETAETTASDINTTFEEQTPAPTDTELYYTDF